MDAAIAVAAGMALCEPCSTGLGGDAFALVYDAATRTVQAMNGSGRCPKGLTPDIAAGAATSSRGTDASSDASGLPPFHVHSITVPGAAAAWCDSLAKWGSGTFSLSQVLAPAVRLANEGFPVAPLTAKYWEEGVPQLTKWDAGAQADSTQLLVRREEAAAAAATSWRAPRAGEVFKNKNLARTLATLGAEGAAGFYRGDPGKAIVEAVKEAGGLMSMEDLAEHTTTFPEPMAVNFCGVSVWEVPPNGQGIVALMALQNIKQILARALVEGKGEGGAAAAGSDLAALNKAQTGDAFTGEGAATAGAWIAGFKLQEFLLPHLSPAEVESLKLLASLGHNSPAYLHLISEALRMGFADARAHVCDSDHPSSSTEKSLPSSSATHSSATSASNSSSSSSGGKTILQPSDFLSDAYASERSAFFNATRAADTIKEGYPQTGSDTVSFSVVDAAGNAVSFINSNYMGFGSGLCPRGVGFSLQNRGAGFSLLPSHPNCLAPGKRPFHTIIPLMLTIKGSSSGGGGGGDGDAFLAAASCMGGFMQPQGHLQLILNLLAYGMDPQTAIDQARLCIADGSSSGEISLEEGIDPQIHEILAAAGHKIAKKREGGFTRSLFGRAQIILRHPSTGVLWGGSDGRGDGLALAVNVKK